MFSSTKAPLIFLIALKIKKNTLWSGTSPIWEEHNLATKIDYR